MANRSHRQPVLRNWRCIKGIVLVGQVTGHPDLVDNQWIVTSKVCEGPDPATGMVRTLNTVYQLEERWPNDREMPPEAHWVLTARILHNLDVISLERAAEAIDAADRFAAKVLGPSPPRQSVTTTDDPERRPSEVQEMSWLGVVSPAFEHETFGPERGKWCIFRPAAEIDAAWLAVHNAALADRLLLAKCSTARRASAHQGSHVICVYCRDSLDRAAVMATCEVLRELGFGEILGYKSDRATRDGIYGTDDEWLYRA